MQQRLFLGEADSLVDFQFSLPFATMHIIKFMKLMHGIDKNNTQEALSWLREQFKKDPSW